MTKKKENNNFRTFLGILAIGIIIFFNVYNNSRLDNQRKKEDYEYVQIENVKNEYRGKILSINSSSGYKGLTLIHLSNNIKLSISESTRNYLYSNQDLNYFIQVGDSLFKPLDSDSLFIIRNNKRYYFILAKRIN